MAEVDLTTIYLHTATDMSTFVTLDVDRMSEATGGYGDVIRLAGGRLVSVTQTGSRSRFTLRADLPTRSDVDLVRTWSAGTTLVYRDPFGRVVYGVVDGDVKVDETAAASRETYAARMSVTLHEITDSAEV